MSSLGSPHIWTCPKHHRRNISGMNPDQMPEPPYVAAFNATESNSFGYYLELMARGDGWNVDQVVNFQVFMLSTFFTTTVQ